jgi:hypothetical protein
VTRGRALPLLAAVWLAATGGVIAGDQMDAYQAILDSEIRIETRLAATLRDRFPELPERGTRSTLERLLTDAGRASGDRRAALLLAADFLAARLAPTDTATPDELARQAPGKNLERSLALSGRTLTWVWSPLGSSWTYDHGLLWVVWREHPDGAWGEEAFLLLLRRGWNTTVFCKDSPDDFREVIREGERFLAARPTTRLRRDVALTLAWAYETWWSASRARPGQGYVDEPATYAAGAAQARDRAIARYDEALRLGLPGALAADARQRLARLRQSADTEQRIFYCVYD